MSRKKLPTYRHKAFLAQSKRCFYCGAEMWLTDPKGFSSRYGLSQTEAWRFKCTAEHLVARCDGGADSQANIVAACAFCNATRHRMARAPEPSKYRHHVSQRVSKNRWHPMRYRHLLAGDHAGLFAAEPQGDG